MSEPSSEIGETMVTGNFDVTMQDATASQVTEDTTNDKDGAKQNHLRMWNPVRDARSPSEDEFSSIEQAFGRFVNFMKNRDEAGLSPEAVRLLHTFYTELDAAAATSKDESSSSALNFVPAECPVHDLANHIQVRRQLESRHLSVLVNLIMMLVEEEQKEVQRLLKFYNLLAESTDNGETEGALHQAIREYPPELLVEIKALTQEHIRLKIDFIAKIKTGRSLMVKCLEGSNRLLCLLRKKAAKHTRRQGQQELAQLRQSFAQSSQQTKAD